MNTANYYQSGGAGQRHNENSGESGYILINSVTYAIKGQRLLERRGFRAFVARDREINRSFGCGYVIKVYGSAQTLASARQTLQSAGIPFREQREPEGGGGK